MSRRYYGEKYGWGEFFLHLAVGFVICGSLFFVTSACEKDYQEDLEREHREKYCDVMILKETEEVYSMHQIEKWGIKNFDPDTKCGFRAYEEDGVISLKNEETGVCRYQAEVQVFNDESQVNSSLLEKTEKCPLCYGDIEAE